MNNLYSQLKNQCGISDDDELIEKIVELDPKLQQCIDTIRQNITQQPELYHPFLYEAAYFLKIVLGYKQQINPLDIFLIFLIRQIDKVRAGISKSCYDFLLPSTISTSQGQGNKIYCLMTCEIETKELQKEEDILRIVKILEKPISFLSMCGLVYSSTIYPKLLEETGGESYTVMGGEELWKEWRKL